MKDPLKEYLVHSYLYYVLADHEFDSLCAYIRKNWEQIESPYKDFLWKYYEVDGIQTLKGLELLADFYPKEIIYEGRRLQKEGS